MPVKEGLFLQIIRIHSEYSNFRNYFKRTCKYTTPHVSYKWTNMEFKD